MPMYSPSLSELRLSARLTAKRQSARLIAFLPGLSLLIFIVILATENFIYMHTDEMILSIRLRQIISIFVYLFHSLKNKVQLNFIYSPSFAMTCFHLSGSF